MSFLNIDGLRKNHGAQQVLRDVSLSVPKGCILALLGASGCGKTTLLRLIAGFEPADAGRITLDGRVLDQGATHVAAEHRHIGYVPQEGTLFPHLSVSGNIGFGLSRAERRAGRIAEAVALTGLEGLETRMPAQISGGQQQRTALARALAPRPALILLDEPFNALDLQLRRSVCADVIALLRAQHATAILVTHDPQEAFDNADLIAVMRAGEIAQFADPATLYHQPIDLQVARLTGTVVLLDGHITGSRAETALGWIDLHPGAPTSGPARILLRREQIVTAPDGQEATILQHAFRGDHTCVTVQAGTAVFDIHMPTTGDLLGTHTHLAVRGPAMAYAEDDPLS